MQMFTLAFIKSRIHYILALLPKLSLFKIYNLFVAFISFRLKRDRSSTAPPLLIINLTFRCNYSCIMCQKNAPGDNPYKNPKSIEFDTLARMLKENARYLSLVRLHGGEPLFYEEIDRLIDLLNELEIPYSIISNGYLLTEEISRKLVGNCVSVSLSIDAVDPDIYSKMRRGGDIGTVTANLQALNTIKREKRSKTPILNLSTCSFGFNMAELPKIVRYCHDNGIESLSAGEGWAYGTPDIKEEDFIKHHTELARKSIGEAQKLADELGIILRTKFPSLRTPTPSGSKKPKKKNLTRLNSCFNLYVSTELHPNLDVIACCDANEPFGSLKDATLQDIWNGPGYIDARKKLRNNEVPAACKGCQSLFASRIANHESVLEKILSANGD